MHNKHTASPATGEGLREALDELADKADAVWEWLNATGNDDFRIADIGKAVLEARMALAATTLNPGGPLMTDNLRAALEWAMAPNPRHEGRHRTEPRCRVFMPTDGKCDCGYEQAAAAIASPSPEPLRLNAAAADALDSAVTHLDMNFAQRAQLHELIDRARTGLAPLMSDNLRAALETRLRRHERMCATNDPAHLAGELAASGLFRLAATTLDPGEAERALIREECPKCGFGWYEAHGRAVPPPATTLDLHPEEPR